MKLKIIAVGKIKEKYFREAIAEYEKRMKRYLPLEIVEVKDEPVRESLSPAEEKMVLEREGEKILTKLSPADFVVPLVIEGKEMDSVAFSQFIYGKIKEGREGIVFIIGGSLGLSENVKRRGDYLLSFSPMTLPHQMMRLVLMEQIYRACRIESGHVYHK